MFRHYLNFANYRAKAELQRDASNMFLGAAWWVLEPVLYMAVFYVVFGMGLRKGGIDFVCYLLCGLVPWKWLDSSVRTASGSILASAGLMRQVYFPKWVLPSYVIIANTYKFLIVLTLLLGFMTWVKGGFSLLWLTVLAIAALQLLLVLGMSWLAAALVPLVPDLRFVVAYGMTLLFFLSGIFFDISELAEPVSSWLKWIPSVILIDMYRGVLLDNSLPTLWQVAVIIAESTAFVIVGLLCLVGLDRYYPRVVN